MLGGLFWKRQAKLDTEAAATGTNLRTAVQVQTLAAMKSLCCHLALLCMPLQGSDLPAVAGSDHVANPSKGSEALQVFLKVLQLQEVSELQPIDVSLDASKAEELSAC